MLWTINHNGYHGYNTVRITVPDGSHEGDLVEVSDLVARRINRAVCGISDCRCGERIARENPNGVGYTVCLPQNGGEHRGWYPQN